MTALMQEKHLWVYFRINDQQRLLKVNVHKAPEVTALYGLRWISQRFSPWIRAQRIVTSLCVIVIVDNL